jgi:DNA-binding response OmpR family regulator
LLLVAIASPRYNFSKSRYLAYRIERVELELLPKVKELRSDVPVIMITAYGDAETKRKALENGAEALLTKSIDFTVLRSEIETRLGMVA